MTWGQEGVRAASLKRASKRTAECRRLTKRCSGERGGVTAEGMDIVAKMDAKKRSIRFLLKMVLVEKLNSVKRELKKTRECLYFLMASLRLTQNALKLVTGELEKGVI